jgi:hypothetical protein
MKEQMMIPNKEIISDSIVKRSCETGKKGITRTKIKGEQQ